MRRFVPFVLALATACGSGSPVIPQSSPAASGPSFRVLLEKQVAAYCVEGPAFDVARSAAEWAQVLRKESECQPGPTETIPSPDFDAEAGVAAWWKVAGCLGYGILTESVARTGDEVTVSAKSAKPAGDACAQALGGLESFLAVRHDLLDGAKAVRFVLDGAEAGRVSL